MRRVTPLSFVMTLSFALLLVSGCAPTKDSPEDVQKEAFQDVRTEIIAAISNDQRATKLVDLLTELEQSFLAAKSNIAERRARVRKLNANYDATRADFAREWDRVLMEMEANRDGATDAYRRVVDQMTAEEWSKVNATESPALSQWAIYIRSE